MLFALFVVLLVCWYAVPAVAAAVPFWVIFLPLVPIAIGYLLAIFIFIVGFLVR